jgi:hypothetical protein
MKKSRYYKAMFLVAGLWNLVLAVPSWLGIVFMPESSSSILGMAPAAVLFPYHAMFWLVVAFGVGYLIVSRDITKNYGIVTIGIIGKTLFFIDCLITLALKQANVVLLLIGIGDLIFACLFLEFLLYARRKGHTPD